MPFISNKAFSAVAKGPHKGVEKMRIIFGIVCLVVGVFSATGTLFGYGKRENLSGPVAGLGFVVGALLLIFH